MENKNKTDTDRCSSTVEAKIGTRVKRWKHMAREQPLGNTCIEVHHA